MTPIRDDKPQSSGAKVDEASTISRPGCFCTLEYERHRYHIMNDDINQEIARRHRRGTTSEILHDLIASSLVPLTEYLETPAAFIKNAEEFMSCFKDRNVRWNLVLDVRDLPYRHANAIYGLTENSRDPDIQYRFLRFRFPCVRFEWHVETPYHMINLLGRKTESVEVKFMWKAWSKYHAAPSVVAFGYCTDTLVIKGNTSSPAIVISKRSFSVTQLVQPTLMMPIPLMRGVPQLSEAPGIAAFSTSQYVIGKLQTSQKLLTFLVAMSALITSISPFVRNHVAGLVLSVIAIVSATMSVLVYVLGRALSWIEGNGARYRNNERYIDM